ncbi:MAG: 1-deoxy-D-xylulose-5-phosphate synthase [Lachnospiraceae bacterium]|nr:1-deoxy-D-xylulose-5-phosphate synthase [Lachnospiraceae bacterium]
MYLEKINEPNDIKKIPREHWGELAEEIRQFLVEKISKTGGHLASNLGVVELTMALHLVYDLPKDKIIWDVGHQSYTHKLLTGRASGFDSLRKFGGMSGFPKRSESDCDAFDTGHSSTSISAGLGYVEAREITGANYDVVSVIGDGALTGGIAYEALNNAGYLGTNYVIVLNDNNMSISPNVGGLSHHLEKIRASEKYRGLKDSIVKSLEKMPNGDKAINKIRRTKSSIKQLIIPGMMFEEMGIIYMGPVDGHNTEEVVKALKTAKAIPGPVLVHVLTEKGKGYEPAENHPSRFHGTGPFEIEKGLPISTKKVADYTDVFGTIMHKLGDKNPKICAISAAMEDGTGLKRFHNFFPERFFDVGIAEGHAVTFAAGLAAGGLIPVFAVYSSFLQRGYDQILSDVCLQNLHVIFAIDRAGLVGADGDTHQGIFDISYLSGIPNLVLMAPKNKWELSDMMKFAVKLKGPSAIRYPRGASFDGYKDFRTKIKLGKAEELIKGSKVMLFAYGSMVETAQKTYELLEKNGIKPTIVNARFAKPFDEEYLLENMSSYKMIVTMEEGILSGGLGERVHVFLKSNGYKGKVLNIGINDTYVEHGNVELLKKELEIDPESIAKKILKANEKTS